jgi:hypothetical protein
VLNKTKLEGCMAMGYMYDEASFTFCTRYLQLYKHTRKKVWHPKEEVIDASEVFQGKGKRKILISMQTIHPHICSPKIDSNPKVNLVSF